MIGLLARLGRWARHVINDLGFAGRFLMQLLWASLLSLKRPRLISEQVYFVGNRSLSIILISGLFVGFVLGLQGYYNLERYGAEGDDFDPALHDALMATTSADVDHPVIGQVLTSGYRRGERVVRAAKVLVNNPE